MAVTHSTAARNAATDAVLALIGVSGKLVFRLAGSVTAPGAAAATLSLSATAFAASSVGTAVANAITQDSNAVGNAAQVATATLQTSGGTIVLQCSVAASGSDINMSNGLFVAPGDQVACSSLTYTALIQ